MNYKKLIGLGILEWLIMFAVVSAVLQIYNSHAWMKLVVAIIAGIVAYILARYMRLTSYTSAWACSMSWLVIGVILDSLITMRYNAVIFSSRALWLGYILMFLAPFAAVREEPVPFQESIPIVKDEPKKAVVNKPEEKKVQPVK